MMVVVLVIVMIIVMLSHAKFVICAQEALASAPWSGDFADIRAKEDYQPSSKAEQHAARLRAEATRLLKEEE